MGRCRHRWCVQRRTALLRPKNHQLDMALHLRRQPGGLHHARGADLSGSLLGRVLSLQRGKHQGPDGGSAKVRVALRGCDWCMYMIQKSWIVKKCKEYYLGTYKIICTGTLFRPQGMNKINTPPSTNSLLFLFWVKLKKPLWTNYCEGSK